MVNFKTILFFIAVFFSLKKAIGQPYTFLREFGRTGTTSEPFGLSHGIAVAPNGNVYVTDIVDKSVKVFNQSGVFLFKFGTDGFGLGQFRVPVDIVLDESGNVYVSDHEKHDIQKFTASGIFIMKFGSQGSGDGQLLSPAGLAIDANETIYVVERQNRRIQKFTKEGIFVGKWGTNGNLDGQFLDPWDIAIDASSNVYVTDRGNHRVQKFTSSGNFLLKWGTLGNLDGQFNMATGIAIDMQGNILVSDHETYRVQIFSPSGTFLSKWGSNGNGPYQFDGIPLFITLDQNGNIYICNFFSVKVFASANSIITSVNSPYSFCPGASLAVNYTSNATFNSGNMFTVQLSDANGSFAIPLTIGAVTSTTPGQITTSIPFNTPPGNGYRVRIMSTTPNIIGSDNGVNLTVHPLPDILNISGPGVVCSGNSGVIYQVADNPGSTYQWTVPPGSVITSGLNTSAITVQFGNTSGNVTVRETSSSGCLGQTYSRSVTVNPSPNNSLIISGPSSVCAGEENVQFSVANPSAASYIWNIPAGVNLVSGAGSSSITVNWGNQGGPVSVSELNACGVGTASYYPVSVSSEYTLGSVTAFCGSSVCVPLRTNGAIKNGLIGLDFVINYDPALVTPTGTASKGPVITSYGAYTLNNSTPGKLRVSVYMVNAPSGTYFSGTGDIICLGFTINNGVVHGTPVTLTTDEIEESTYIGSDLSCNAVPANLTVSGVLGGRIIYRNASNKPLIYSVTNPSAYKPTDITGVDNSCGNPSSEVVRPNTTGIFSYNPFNGDRISIQRDITGDASMPTINCANVQSVINSSDYLRAAQIASYALTNPNIYELLSADVNLDGKVTAGDVSLISSRAVNSNNCEFPQAWNYTWDGNNYVPASGYSRSIDWLFLDDATLVSPAFTSGFDRDHVPSVPECLSLPSGTPGCITTVTGIYHAVLLGDVNGNWTSGAGTQLKAGSIAEILIDLNNMVIDGTSKTIPVYYTGDEYFTGLDFSFDYSDKISISGVNMMAVTGGVQWNAIGGQRLMVSSWSSDSIALSEPILYLEVEADEAITEHHFADAEAYLNGEPANVVFKKTAVSFSQEEVVNVYPNPSNGQVYLNVKDQMSEVEVVITNAEGQKLFENKHVPTQSEYLLPELGTGFYYIQVKGSGEIQVKKLVKF